MKVLKNKTYKDLMLKLEKSESDLKKQIEKTNNVQCILNLERSTNEENVEELEEKDVFINALNERVQKAEASYEKLKELFGKSISENAKLMSEKLELESKLSRKGLGVKGKKKNNGTFPYDYNTEIHKKA